MLLSQPLGVFQDLFNLDHLSYIILYDLRELAHWTPILFQASTPHRSELFLRRSAISFHVSDLYFCGGEFQTTSSAVRILVFPVILSLSLLVPLSCLFGRTRPQDKLL